MTHPFAYTIVPLTMTVPIQLSKYSFTDNGNQAKKPKMEKENEIPIVIKREDDRKVLDDTTNRTFHIYGAARYPGTPPSLRPKACVNPSGEPTTPTTNFRMLSTIAASLDYLEGDSRSSSSTGGDTSGIEGSPFTFGLRPSNENKSFKISRKERSLAFICDRFLSSYPDYPEDNERIFISIDLIATKLGVERRRMYDIVNVLESVNILRKTSKNKYQYFGKKNLLPQLKSLSEKAKHLRLKERLEGSLPPNCWEENEKRNTNFPRKDKTLGAASQKFLMLFLCSEQPIPITLQTAAHILLGQSKCEKDAVQFKTKIRRLYDVANIFMSIGLIEKDNGKQCFKYVGPNLAFLQNSGNDPKDEAQVLKHLFPDNKPTPSSQSPLPAALSSKVPFPRTRSANWNSPQPSATKSFVRHASLHDICTVAEVARKKLYDSEKSLEAPVASKEETSISLARSNSTEVLSTPRKVQQQSRIQIKMPNNFIFGGKIKPVAKNQNTSILQKLTVLPKPAEQSSVTATVVEPVENSKTPEVKVADTQLNNHRVIKLTPEQRDKILKCLNVSLGDGQVASILISGSKAHTSLSEEQQNSSEKSDQSDLSSNLSEHSTNASTDTVRKNMVSPFSIPSGYATPSISQIGNPVFLPNKEVEKLLNTMDNKLPLLQKYFTDAQEIASVANEETLFVDKDNLDDSTDREVEFITKYR